MGRLDSIKRQRLDKRLLSSNYPVDLVPEILDIPDFIEIVHTEERKKEAKVEVEAKIQNASRTPEEIPIPLTEAQAEAIDLRIKSALSNIGSARKGLQDVRQDLEKRIIDQDTESVSFSIDIKKKGRLARAIKKLWGEKREELTFNMYKELLEAKKKLEQQEIEKFASGKMKR